MKLCRLSYENRSCPGILTCSTITISQMSRSQNTCFCPFFWCQRGSHSNFSLMTTSLSDQLENCLFFLQTQFSLSNLKNANSYLPSGADIIRGGASCHLLFSYLLTIISCNIYSFVNVETLSFICLNKTSFDKSLSPNA